MSEEIRQFWMVYVEGKVSPTVQHFDFAEAKREAVRLAQKERCKAFVMESVVAFDVPHPIILLHSIPQSQP